MRVHRTSCWSPLLCFIRNNCFSNPPTDRCQASQLPVFVNFITLEEAGTEWQAKAPPAKTDSRWRHALFTCSEPQCTGAWPRIRGPHAKKYLRCHISMSTWASRVDDYHWVGNAFNVSAISRQRASSARLWAAARSSKPVPGIFSE